MTAGGLVPIPLLAFLRHPLSRFAAEPQAIDALEQAILRGPRPAAGAEGLARAVEDQSKLKFHPRDARARLRQDDWDRAARLAERVAHALAPLGALAKNALPLAKLLDAHREALALAGLDLGGSDRADTEALAAAFDTLRAAAADAFELSLADYADLDSFLLLKNEPLDLIKEKDGELFFNSL